MFVGKPLPDSLRRFFAAKNADPQQGVRQIATTSSLRQLIEGAVIRFAPLQLPQTFPPVQCTGAQVDLASDGSYRFRADVSTSLGAMVAVAIGFALNANGAGDSWVSLLNSQGTGRADRFDQQNSSSWLRANWNLAMSNGLSFGLYATTDVQMTPGQFSQNALTQMPPNFWFMQDDQSSDGSEIDNIIAAGEDPYEDDETDVSDFGQSVHIGMRTIRRAASLLGLFSR
jgi:hypothetical protein